MVLRTEMRKISKGGSHILLNRKEEGKDGSRPVGFVQKALESKLP